MTATNRPAQLPDLAADTPGYATRIWKALATNLPAEMRHASEESARAFVDAFWRGVRPEDLAARSQRIDVALTVDAWLAFARFQGDEPSISVLPPVGETTHSVLRIVLPDQPFVTDSVLMELARAEIELYYLHNVTLRLHKDQEGRIEGLLQSDATRAAAAETLLYAELEPLTHAEAEELAAALATVLADVIACVQDHGAMKAKAAALAAELDAEQSEEASEAASFLRWLCDDHFTFMGFRSFDFSAGAVTQIDNSALGTLTLRPPASRRQMAELRESTREFLLEPTKLSFSKAGRPSRVHRPAYPDYIGVKRFDADGNVIGEDGFLGLYTSPVYTDRPATIPVLRRKVADVLARSRLSANSFDGKALKQVLATYPRDALLQTPLDELYDTSTAIAHIHERRTTRVFLRRGRYGLFYNCLVFMPRDSLSTRVRIAIRDLLVERLNAQDVEFDAFFSESILVRLQFTLRVDPGTELTPEIAALEAEIVELSRDWRNDFRIALKGLRGGSFLPDTFREAFSADYQAHFDVADAVADSQRLAQLKDASDLALDLYQRATEPANQVHVKLLRRGDLLPLSTVVPLLENLGFGVVSEHPYSVTTDSASYVIQDFTLEHTLPLAPEDLGESFGDAVRAIWSGVTESDTLNALIVAERLSWRAVSLLRSYSRYLKQVGLGFGQSFIADTLHKHTDVARLLIELFHRRLGTASPTEALIERLEARLDQVELLNEDRVLRLLMTLITATVRSNFYTPRSVDPGLLVHKLDAQQLPFLPAPRPYFEIFVYAPDMEGVHLRDGPIARGGIRWSDRQEDYRTEILGLVKAQIVKNAVIVPTGAKGGFVVKTLATGLDRDAWLAEGERCYRRFIGGLLRVTDNLAGDVVVPPSGVVRCDADDPYLVVAADKGTATFSDLANAIADDAGFWLSDAFASGGSLGYDHKKLGITARGAWVSVQRHFANLGKDVQRDPLSVVGIGDMAGDVFGNGMLCSTTIELVAAFNHLHIFIDPNPDAAAAFEERKRLFNEPRSSWSDYRQDTISRGGGVFSRTQKAIPLSPEMRQRFGIDAAELTPDELIHQLLQAEVDLLWNGGIGTYVKASHETHADVGDRANDAIRINGRDVRAKVIGEGGNLGATHSGRIEFAAAGGRVNADFIDNAAGVDCSDHEVNLKILLAHAVDTGDLDAADRDSLLLAQADDVADLVLDNNFRQARSLHLAVLHSTGRIDEYDRLAVQLETAGLFDRVEADFPTEEDLQERARTGAPLLLPELATLLGHAKIQLKALFSAASLHTDPVIGAIAETEFPQPIVQRFDHLLPRHRLAPEIVATLLANEVVGYAGITFVARMMEIADCSATDVVRAYWVATRLADLPQRIDWVDASSAAPEDRDALLLDLLRLCRRTTRWLLRRHGSKLDVETLLRELRGPVTELLEAPDGFLADTERVTYADREARFDITDDAPPGAVLGIEAFGAIAVAEVASTAGTDPALAAAAHLQLASALRLDRLAPHFAGLAGHSHWQTMERDAMLDDIAERHLELTITALKDPRGIDVWQGEAADFFARWQQILQTLPDGKPHFAALSMTIRKLLAIRTPGSPSAQG